MIMLIMIIIIITSASGTRTKTFLKMAFGGQRSILSNCVDTVHWKGKTGTTNVINHLIILKPEWPNNNEEVADNTEPNNAEDSSDCFKADNGNYGLDLMIMVVVEHGEWI